MRFHYSINHLTSNYSECWRCISEIHEFCIKCAFFQQIHRHSLFTRFNSPERWQTANGFPSRTSTSALWRRRRGPWPWRSSARTRVTANRPFSRCGSGSCRIRRSKTVAWVSKCPPTFGQTLKRKFQFPDARFMLRFLRFKKFSVVQAQEALERYVLLRQTFGVAFNCLDITIPMMQDLTDLGYLFACPKRDSKGRRVVIARPGQNCFYPNSS